MTPAVVGDAVFVGSCSGRFYAFGRRTGDVRWSYDTGLDGPPASFHGDALVAGELIVVGSDVPLSTGARGHLYAFEQATGDVRWKHAAPGGVAADVLRAGDRIFAVDQNGELLCLGLADGEVRWRVPTSLAPGAGSRLRYSLVLIEDRLVFPSPGGVVRAVAADSGEVLWTQRLDDEVNTSLTAMGDQVFVGTLGNMIHRLHAATGDAAAPRAVDSYPYGAPAPAGDSLVFLIGGETLSRIDAALEDVLWSASIEGEWSTFRPQMADGKVLAGSDRNEIVVLDLSSGEVLETLPVRGTPRGFVLVDGLLHVGTLNGRFLTYRLGS